MIHMDRLEPAPQGLAHLINMEFWGRWADDMNDGTAGGGMMDSPTNGAGNGQRTDGVGEAGASNPPTIRGDGPWTPGGGLRDPDRPGGDGQGLRVWGG